MMIDARSSQTEPRSRRAILAGALTGLAGLIAGRAAAPDVTRAASGDPLIIGSLTNNAGTAGTTLTTNSTGTGLLVTQNGAGTALRGSAVGAGSIAGFFTATNGTGISGVTGNGGTYGVFAQNNGAAGIAGALRASGGQNHGVVATTAHGNANAVKAVNGALDGTAILGQATATTGSLGVGIRGETDGEFGSGVVGSASSTTGTPHGVTGDATAPAGTGVYGQNTGSFGGGAAVRAEGGQNHGVVATSSNGSAYAVRATNNGDGGQAIRGEATAASGIGVLGVASFATGFTYGVYAQADSPSGYGVYSFGNAGVAGNLGVSGAIFAGTKDFKIDHPLDPAQKFLSHSCVESDDRRTVYDGEVTLDAKGEATVVLPAWFGALNGNARIQLTAIGAAAPGLHVKAKVANNRFAIAGGASGREIYWHLSAIRQDAYAKAHPLAVEAAKTGTERGRYLHPEVYGKPASRSIDALRAHPLPAVDPTGASAPAPGH